MSRTVTIPTSERRFWECEVNGKKFRYVAGTTQTVPDEVAAIIDQINAMAPAEAPEQGEVGDVWTKTAEGAEWQKPAKELPAVTDADDGKVLTVDGGEWVAAEASGGGDVVTCHLTVAWNSDDSYFEATAQDKSATEMSTAYAAGKQVQALVTGVNSNSTTFTLCLTNTLGGSQFFGCFYNSGEVQLGEAVYSGMFKARIILGATYSESSATIEPLMF